MKVSRCCTPFKTFIWTTVLRLRRNSLAGDRRGLLKEYEFDYWRRRFMNLLEQLKTMTVVVADTGDFESLAQYTPRDSTTNPSLIYQAAQMPQYQRLIDEAIESVHPTNGISKDQMDALIDRLFVDFGQEILK